MKSKVSKKPTRGILSPSLTVSPVQVFSIRRHTGFWSLTFKGQEACFDHEQGAYYVAWLLLNPPSEPIHGMALEIKSMAYFGQFLNGPAETEIVDPSTGETMILACDAIFEQRNFALDDAESIRPLRRKQLELEAILDNEHASEPVKAEVQRELAELYAWQKMSHAETMDTAQKAVRAVRWTLTRFNKHLATAVDPRGNPHPVLRAFAAHLQEHLLIPSARYCKTGGAPTIARVAGTFTYEPPSGVKWTA
jgi:hypothetical protein